MGNFVLGVQNEAGQRLTEFCQENALVRTNTLSQQHRRWLNTWTSPDDQHQNQIDYILYSRRWRSSIQSAKTRPGAACGSAHELPIAKFRPKLKKVGKTSRPFRYDLNLIPLPEELWTEVPNTVQEAMIKTIPKKKKFKKAKWLSEEGLQMAEKRR